MTDAPNPNAAEAAYLAALEAAAASTTTAAEMRTQAQALWKAANDADGPAIMAAKAKLQQYRQFRQRNGVARG